VFISESILNVKNRSFSQHPDRTCFIVQPSKLTSPTESKTSKWRLKRENIFRLLNSV
jgi:hypothetical protein